MIRQRITLAYWIKGYGKKNNAKSNHNKLIIMQSGISLILLLKKILEVILKKKVLEITCNRS